MKRLSILTTLLFLAFAGFSQTLTYRVDNLTDGGLYLVEIQTPAPDSTGKAGTPVEYSQKFKDKAALVAFVKGMREQAEKIRSESAAQVAEAAKKASEDAGRRAQTFDILAGKIEAVIDEKTTATTDKKAKKKN